MVFHNDPFGKGENPIHKEELGLLLQLTNRGKPLGGRRVQEVPNKVFLVNFSKIIPTANP